MQIIVRIWNGCMKRRKRLFMEHVRQPVVFQGKPGAAVEVNFRSQAAEAELLPLLRELIG